MPTYDYKCTSCNNTFEFFQKITDEPLEKCPECNGTMNYPAASCEVSYSNRLSCSLCISLYSRESVKYFV